PVILIAFTALILAVLPVRVQFVPNEASAEATTSVENHAAHNEAATTSTTTVSTTLVQNEQPASNVVEYTLRTAIGGTPAMAFVGVGGEIDGVSNPDLHATVGDTVRLTV